MIILSKRRRGEPEGCVSERKYESWLTSTIEQVSEQLIPLTTETEIGVRRRHTRSTKEKS